MPRSQSRAQCVLASSLPADRPTEPLAKWSARRSRGACRTGRPGVTRGTNARGRRR